MYSDGKTSALINGSRWTHDHVTRNERVETLEIVMICKYMRFHHRNPTNFNTINKYDHIIAYKFKNSCKHVYYKYIKLLW